MLLSHDQLEGAVYFVSITLGGWVYAWTKDKKQSEIEIKKINAMISKQWDKIDEINKNYVSRDYHDDTRKEMTGVIERAIGTLTSAIDRLSDKVDRAIEKKLLG